MRRTLTGLGIIILVGLVVFGLTPTWPGRTDAEDWLVSLTIFTAIPAICFPFLYATTPWWRSHLGRAVMVKATGVMLLCSGGLIARFLPADSLILLIVRLGIFTLVPLGIWYQFLSFVGIKYDAYREQRDEWEMLNDRASPSRRAGGDSVSNDA